MSRPIEYNLDEVLDKAMDIFWKKGYTGVSMADIVKYTGLNRRTMYSLFQDKEGLFKDTLEHYYTKLSQKKLFILKENPGKKGIEIFLNTFTFAENFKGCLFSNSIREKDFVTTETFEIPKKFFVQLQNGLEENLKQAQKDGDFSGNIHGMALTIISVIHGFHVYGKYNHTKDDSNALFKNVIDMIK